MDIIDVNECSFLIIPNGALNPFDVLLTQYCSGDKIEKNEVGGARMEEGRGVHKVLVGKPEGKSH